jgi:hypothetical protein
MTTGSYSPRIKNRATLRATMRELKPGLWHWQARHPDWTPEERWPQLVSSYAIDDGANRRR